MDTRPTVKSRPFSSFSILRHRLFAVLLVTATTAACSGNDEVAPTCTDGILNADETDIDCGGACGACGAGLVCVAPTDCESSVCTGGTCQTPTCNDGVQNGTETDIDCGGACGACDVGEGCAAATDCTSRVCTDNVCVASGCTDGIRNGTETDVDCGGSCGPCADGLECSVAADCANSICESGTCQAAACDDGIRNGTETDVDCGGPCDPCADGLGCGIAGDCVSGVCTSNQCAVPACDDSVRNGTETDVDCGGPCDACADGLGCAVGGDCVSNVCGADGTCLAAACADGQQNGDESAVDCGGSCDPCADGLTCGVAADCQSLVCDGGTCAAPACDDTVRNADETDVDCGGSCPACADGLSCGVAADCQSLVCGPDSLCAVPACDDTVRNADETDVDCGGSCPACADGLTCAVAGDCQSLVCGPNNTCSAPACDDGVRNADETDIDCGGSCPACADGLACTVPADCQSAVCGPDNTCSVPACDDGVRNADETDIDCGGGTCPGCARGDSCLVLSDCEAGIDACVNGTCVLGPTANFTIAPTRADAPLPVTVTDLSTAGDSPIETVEVDYGDGDDFVASLTHTYETPGTYTATLRVTDENGLISTATGEVEALTPFSCFFSSTDISPASEVVLALGGLAGDWRSTATGGIRSECSIASGGDEVYYAEVTRAPLTCDRSEAPASCVPAFTGLTTLGIGTAAVALNAGVGATDQGIGIDTGGSIISGGDFQVPFDPLAETYGLVVDYRGASPTVYVIADNFGATEIIYSETMTEVTDPVHVIITSPKRLLTPDLAANFGNDVTNVPYAYDPEAVLRADGLIDVADALVPGFGGVARPPLNVRPTITVSADQTVPVGTEVTVTGSAADDEDGDLTANILWEDMATRFAGRLTGTGGSFTFTPTEIGVHPVRATIVDSDGGRRQAQVNITATGDVPTVTPVRLDPTLAGTGDGIELDANGLQALWVIDDKMGIRANQPMIGAFQYFEVTRLGGPINQGTGLSILDGSLNPYEIDGSPPSLAINTSGGIWQSICFLQGYDTTNTTYGFAVDYRGLNPIVYVIIGNVVVYEYVMYDAFVPVYPMVYGNPDPDPASGPYDMQIQFTGDFTYDPAAAMTTYGVPAADLLDFEEGWSG